jgi:hypothetical protein
MDRSRPGSDANGDRFAQGGRGNLSCVREDLRCPVCGVGVVRDLAFDAEAENDDGRAVQDPSAREITEFTCGHSVEGPRLETADQAHLAVERRTSEETTDPPTAG